MPLRLEQPALVILGYLSDFQNRWRQSAGVVEVLYCEGSTVSRRPMALVTATNVDRRGLPLTDNAR